MIACGHKFHTDKQPNNNCIYCWQAFFHTVANIEELFGELRALGVKKFSAKYGIKFTKNLRGFVTSELAKNQLGQEPAPTAMEVEGEKTEIEGSVIPAAEVQEAVTTLELP